MLIYNILLYKISNNKIEIFQFFNFPTILKNSISKILNSKDPAKYALVSFYSYLSPSGA